MLEQKGGGKKLRRKIDGNARNGPKMGGGEKETYENPKKRREINELKRNNQLLRAIRAVRH